MEKKVYTLTACIETTEDWLEVLQKLLIDHPDIHSVSYVDEAAVAELTVTPCICAGEDYG